MCKSCGTEIADTALICFKCGTATAEPERRPVPLEASRRPWVAVILAVLFVVVTGVSMVQLADGEPPEPLVWLMLAVAGGLLAWRLRFR